MTEPLEEQSSNEPLPKRMREQLSSPQPSAIIAETLIDSPSLADAYQVGLHPSTALNLCDDQSVSSEKKEDTEEDTVDIKHQQIPFTAFTKDSPHSSQNKSAVLIFPQDHLAENIPNAKDSKVKELPSSAKYENRQSPQTESSSSIETSHNFPASSLKAIPSPNGDRPCRVTKLLRNSRNHCILEKVQKPEDYDILTNDEKARFLILLYHSIWRSHEHRGTGIYTLIETFLGKNRMPKNCIGINQLKCLPGIFCYNREQLCLLGLHFNAARDISMTSDMEDTPVIAAVVLNGGDSDWLDMGSKFVYVAHGGSKQADLGCRDAIFESIGMILQSRDFFSDCFKQRECPRLPSHSEFDFSDHSLYTQENISLVNSCKLENPIRVIRSFRGKSKFSPMGGYRYDGLYRIIDFFVDTNSRDKRIYKFVFTMIDSKFYKIPMRLKDSFSIHPPIASKHRPLARLLMRNIATSKRSAFLQPPPKQSGRLFDVVLNEKAIFQVSLREIVPLSSSDHDSILINFIVLFKTIKRVYIDYCNKMECAPVWLETVKLYELPQFHPSKPEWARGGFLPFLLRVKYQNVMDSPAFTRENKNLFAPSFSPHMTNTREYRSTWQHFTLPINRRMAQRLAHQFFPESRNPLIFTEIVLNAPMDNAWNPWEDLSHGEENFPLKVENLVDSTTPPLDFTYSKKNVFFSRLIPPDLMKNCPGCLPAGVDTSQWPIRNSSIYCIGKQNPANGRIYCAGRDVEKIQLFNFNFTCGDLCPCDPSACTTRYLPGLKFRCKLVKTLTKNWELQTEEFIPSGRFILQYAGEVISRVVMEGREHISEKLGHSNYFMESVEKEEKSDDWMMPCIDSSIIGNAARFLNHSCSPNVCVKTVWCCSDFPVLCVSALRDIEVHETLTYYYGQSYQQIKCLCGSLNCEGFIGRKPSSPSKR